MFPNDWLQDFSHSGNAAPHIPILKQAKTAIRLRHLPESLVEDKLSRIYLRRGQIVPDDKTRLSNPLILQG